MNLRSSWLALTWRQCRGQCWAEWLSQCSGWEELRTHMQSISCVPHSIVTQYHGSHGAMTRVDLTGLWFYPYSSISISYKLAFFFQQHRLAVTRDLWVSDHKPLSVLRHGAQICGVVEWSEFTSPLLGKRPRIVAVLTAFQHYCSSGIGIFQSP